MIARAVLLMYLQIIMYLQSLYVAKSRTAAVTCYILYLNVSLLSTMLPTILGVSLFLPPAGKQ